MDGWMLAMPAGSAAKYYGVVCALVEINLQSNAEPNEQIRFQKLGGRLTDIA